MRVKRMCLVATLVGALGVAGCRIKDETAGNTVRIPEPPRAADVREEPLPKGKKSKEISDLGGKFCKASVKADFEALTELFHVKYIVMANPGIAWLDDDTAETDMERETIRAMRDDMKASRTARVTDCGVVEARTVACNVMAQFTMHSPMEELTAQSIGAALDRLNIKKCGLLVLRETSNAAVEEPRFFVGKVGKNWMILLGLTG